MRARTAAIPAALLGAIALALVPALPAAAAEQVWDGTGGAGQWWSDGTAWTGAPLVNGDSVTFSAVGGGIQTQSSISDFGGALTLENVRFATSHSVNSSTTTLTTTGGVSVTAGSTVLLNSNVTTSGPQSWLVGPSSQLTLPGVVLVDPASSFTLEIDGLVNATGNIDGQVTGLVTKIGEGTLVRTGNAGGAIGGGGLLISEGVVLLDGVGGSGTSYVINGGTLAGDRITAGITLTSGVIAPGGATAGPQEILVGLNGVALNGGTYEVSIAPGETVPSDYISAADGVLSGTGTMLELQVTSTPTIGDAFEIAGVQFGTIDPAFRFRGPDGAVLEEGAEFVSGGGIWSISYIEVVEIEYLGLAPVTPVTPTMPPTGQEIDWIVPVGIGAGVLVLGGLAVVVVRAVRSRRAGDD